MTAAEARQVVEAARERLAPFWSNIDLSFRRSQSDAYEIRAFTYATGSDHEPRGSVTELRQRELPEMTRERLEAAVLGLLRIHVEFCLLDEQRATGT